MGHSVRIELTDKDLLNITRQKALKKEFKETDLYPR